MYLSNFKFVIFAGMLAALFIIINLIPDEVSFLDAIDIARKALIKQQDDLTTQDKIDNLEKKLNIIDFEPAIPEDEYFSNLQEFQSNNINDDEYFPEFLWKEREVTPWNTRIFRGYTGGDPALTTKLEIVFGGTTNFRIGDIMNIYNVGNSTVYSSPGLIGTDTEDGINTTILAIEPSGATQGQTITVDIDLNLRPQNLEPEVYFKLVKEFEESGS